MKNSILIAGLFLSGFVFPNPGQAQTAFDSVKISVMEEGKRLYFSELASWYATEILKSKHKAIAKKTGGGFSYQNNDEIISVFYNRDEEPKIIFSVRFNQHFNTEQAITDLQSRSFSQLEESYYQIHSKTIELVNTDQRFRLYKDADLHIIPIINGDLKKVYVMAAPRFEGAIVFGNDYLLSFDKNSELRGWKAIHQSIIPVEYGVNNVYNSSEIAATAHEHGEGTDELISATDICNLLLYQKFTNWKQHMVIGKDLVSIWNCSTSDFRTLKKSEFQNYQALAKQRNEGRR